MAETLKQNDLTIAVWTQTWKRLAGEAAEPVSRAELERGWRFSHLIQSINQIETRQGLALAQALAELFITRGLLSEEDLQAAFQQARQALEEQPVPKVMLAQGGDKYAPENNAQVDCLERLPICKARCCTFGFCLTEQDLDEGIARWDYGAPYWIRRREDGYCIHCDPEIYQCTIFEHRPLVCRAYDCQSDKRVWIDSEQMVMQAQL